MFEPGCNGILVKTPGFSFCDVPRDTLLLGPVRAQLREAVVPAMKAKIKEAIKDLEEALEGGTSPPLPDEDDASQTPEQRLVLANAMAGISVTFVDKP